MKKILCAIQGVYEPLVFRFCRSDLTAFFANEMMVRVRALQSIYNFSFGRAIDFRDQIVFTFGFYPDRLDAVHTLSQDSSTGAGSADGDVQHRVHAESLRQFRGCEGYHYPFIIC